MLFWKYLLIIWVLHAQVANAKDFIKHRILERIEDKQVPHQVEFSSSANDAWLLQQGTHSLGIPSGTRSCVLHAPCCVKSSVTVLLPCRWKSCDSALTLSQWEQSSQNGLPPSMLQLW